MSLEGRQIIFCIREFLMFHTHIHITFCKTFNSTNKYDCLIRTNESFNMLLNCLKIMLTCRKKTSEIPIGNEYSKRKVIYQILKLKALTH